MTNVIDILISKSINRKYRHVHFTINIIIIDKNNSNSNKSNNTFIV